MSIGGLIALIVLILCIILAVVGPPIPMVALGMIAGLAIAILLSGVPITWRSA